MDKKIIIGLVGKIASGKGTVAEHIEKNHGAVTYRFSTILRDILGRIHKEINRGNMQALSTTLRENFGEDLLASVIAEDVKKDESKVVIVDGVRRLADIKYLQEMENFILVSVDAKPEIRYERLIQRTENAGDTSKTYEEFLADEKKEADAEIPVVMEKSHKILNNDQDFDNLYTQIDEILKNV